jgi:hypothetical protein
VTVHAILSASGSERWEECSPSARLEEQLPDKPSVYSAAGNLGHSLAEARINLYLGNLTEEEYAVAHLQLKAHELYTEALQEIADEYYDIAVASIMSIREVNKDALILVEKRLDFSKYVPEGFGTGDLVLICDGLIWVIDLKTGAGKYVEAEGNRQMRWYAVGAVEEAIGLYKLDRVRMTVVQPAKNNYGTEEISVDELKAWAEARIEKAQLAWEGKGEFKPGDWCGFCKAKGNCKARAELNSSIDPVDPRLLSLEEVSKLLAHAKQLKTWATDLENFAFEKALSGEKVPGYKIVEGRSNRRIKDHDAAAARLIAAGYSESILYERSLLGLTALEKAVGKKAFTELLDGLIEKPKGSATMVPDSDKRPEYELDNSYTFEPIEN